VLGATAMQNFAFSDYSTIKNLPAKLSGTEIGLVQPAALHKILPNSAQTYSFGMLNLKNEKINDR
jgi:hypothetical protein